MATLQKLGSLFYVVGRNSTTFQTIEEVPKIINEAVPMFLGLMVLEIVVLQVTGRGRVRIGDVLTSGGTGLMYETSKLTMVWVELSLYQWLYQWRLLDLDWTSAGTWWAAALGVDFAYYWYHRAIHEVNIGWAAHQVHHSSQDYNFSTALRQSIFQRFFSLPCYTPLALLGIPLPAIMTHIQLNLLYQFWIHTEMVGTLGPLEWIFNTPSHHRVHHGANKWCLDKNYAGVLIVWDRLFGTFEAERRGQDGEEIAYGLVDPPQSLNSVWHQLFYYRAVFAKARSMSTWGDTFRALFYGPGWVPGSPRLGDLASFPDVKAPRPLYDPKIPGWEETYVTVHYIVGILIQQLLVANPMGVSWEVMVVHVVFLITTLGVIGATYDGRWWAVSLDAARCLAFFTYTLGAPVTPWPAVNTALSLCLASSALLQTCRSLARLVGSPARVKTE